MSTQPDKFIPALKYNFLTPLFDPILRWTLRDASFKRALIDQSRMASDCRVLDVGCGTGTLLIETKKRYPDAKAAGLDGDPRILAMAAEKTRRAGLSIYFEEAMSFKMPYADSTFDRVFSSLFFHHLTTESKRRTLREMNRVLRPGGELHIADWGKADNPLMRILFYQVQILDGFETTQDSVLGVLPGLMREAGFAEAAQVRSFPTVFGPLCLYRALKPGTLTARGD